MSISTYGELKAAIAAWMNRDDQEDRIPEFVALAEDRIAADTRIRLRAMETSAALVVNVQTVALPTGFLGQRGLYIGTNPKTRPVFVAPDLFWQLYDSSLTGQPRDFTIEGDNLVFGPIPDAEYTGRLLYWKRFTALAADGDTNWLLLNARGLLLNAALLEAAIYREDDAAALRFSTLYDEQADRLRKANTRERIPLGACVRSEVMSP